MAACRDNIDAVMHRRGVSPDTWIAPSLAGNWTNYGAPWCATGYYKDVTNRVWLRGLLGVLPVVGTNSEAPPSTITTLPAQYTPVARVMLTTIAQNSTAALTLCRLDIDASGNVIFQALAAGTAAVFISLEGLSFSVN